MVFTGAFDGCGGCATVTGSEVLLLAFFRIPFTSFFTGGDWVFPLDDDDVLSKKSVGRTPKNSGSKVTKLNEYRACLILM